MSDPIGWIVNAAGRWPIYETPIKGEFAFEVVPGNSAEFRPHPALPANPPCIGCGGPTDLYGVFRTTEWNCKDSAGCGSYVLKSDRIGTEGGKPDA